MALEEPKVRLDLKLGLDLALAEQSAHVADVADAIEHEQRWQWQLGIARPEQFPSRAGEKRLHIKRCFAYLFIHVPMGTRLAYPPYIACAGANLEMF